MKMVGGVRLVILSVVLGTGELLMFSYTGRVEA